VNEPLEFTLSGDECRLARWAGEQRNAVVMRRNARDLGVRASSNEKRLANDIQGVGAEYAVAKWWGRYWCPQIAPANGAPDVGPWEVRQCQYDSGHLAMAARDKPRFYILALGTMPAYRLAGRLYWPGAANAGALSKYRRPDGGWWIPQHELEPLPRLVYCPTCGHVAEPTRRQDEIGPCAACRRPTVRYGDHGKPLCAGCDEARLRALGGRS
jgi:hypothetical protein